MENTNEIRHCFDGDRCHYRSHPQYGMCTGENLAPCRRGPHKPGEEPKQALSPSEREVEKAYQILEAYGVTKERARTIANGIDVLVTRLGREMNDYITYIADRNDKLQYLVDNWPTPLEDCGITLPDGDFLPQTPKEKT